MAKFGGYSIGIAQIGDEIKEKLNFRICPISTISLLVSRSDIPIMRCFSIGGMKKQYAAILESFGTTEEIFSPLTCLLSTTYPLLSPLLLLKLLKIPLLLLFSIFEVILNQNLT